MLPNHRLCYAKAAAAQGVGCRWMTRSARSETCVRPFATQDGRRPLKRADIWRFFGRYRALGRHSEVSRAAH